MRPAVFLDRDGVINVDHGFVGKVEDFVMVEGAAEAISFLNQRGFLVFVVTNQSGIGHGYYSEADFQQVMRHLDKLLAAYGAHIDDVRHCPFHPGAKLPSYRCDHPWRKPEPGMILDIIDTWDIDIDLSFMIGDAERDLQAANAAGLKAYLFRGGNLLHFVEALVTDR
ncbi:HAD family hydrolase [Mycolicibacterium neoaurum]|uniref:D-glycero-alpha-D-manno-heptose-1,7-bisphosphate 7-phosphatase n=1 Tax=Mycolicibacterium neoaurum TaxID=1795 RepID=UPI00248CE26F|nr:HAD family hydrolase [Mycolicibacterium neoaurum]WBP96214.1 HAD family hydrolase [Mycolicibacterium neoaurum]WBS10255.1 HAD family hydrolase [Mycolicibacterium neoaurum]